MSAKAIRDKFINGEILQLQDCAELIAIALKWEKLIELCGHLQDGSQTTVKLYQDDATRTAHITVGKVSYFGADWSDVLNKIQLPEKLSPE